MKKITGVAILLATITVIIMQSCGTVNQPLNLNDLNGQWVLKTLNGKQADTLFTRQLPTLEFNFESKTISGTGGCNRYTGRFILINNILTAPNLATTRMMCIEPNAEDEFFRVFQSDNTLSVKDGVLSVRNNKNKVVMEFGKSTESGQNIDAHQLNGTWVLSQMRNQPAIQIFTGAGATIPNFTFDVENRKITGMAGCNRFNTGGMVEGNKLILSGAITTRMACPNLQGENQFLEEFRGELRFSMPDNNTLRLLKNNITVLEFKRGSGGQLV